MKTSRFQRASAGAGFTMIEIALSIAIVGFALVAIMGILPTGMTVERDNREDTIMAQEGRYWLEAIRTGAAGLDELTNYVDEVVIAFVEPNRTTYLTNSLILDGTNFTGRLILQALTTPKYIGDFPTNVFTRVTARVRPITGNAVDVGLNTNVLTSGFRYEVQSEVVPERTFPVEALAMVPAAQTNAMMAERSALEGSLRNVRLTLRYPMYERGTGWVPGPGRKTLRAKISGAVSNNLPTPNVFAQF